MECIYSIFTGDDLYEVNNGNLKITDSDKKESLENDEMNSS